MPSPKSIDSLENAKELLVGYTAGFKMMEKSSLDQEVMHSDPTERFHCS